MTERQALLGAGVAHLLLFAALSVGWQLQRDLAPAPDDAIPVEVIDVAEAPRTPVPPRPSREAAPQETVAPELAPEPPQPEPTPAPPEAVPPPEPAPKPVPPKPAPQQPTPPKAEPRPLDTSRLENLIDKSLPKARTKPLDTSKLADTIASAAPKAATVDPRAAATLAQSIRAQVAPCWNPPIGGQDVRRMTVTIRARYGRDGRLADQPTVGGQTGVTAANGDYARAFAETARRAVLRCQPLKLPPDLYDLWKSVDINFDPESMA